MTEKSHILNEQCRKGRDRVQKLGMTPVEAVDFTSDEMGGRRDKHPG